MGFQHCVSELYLLEYLNSAWDRELLYMGHKPQTQYLRFGEVRMSFKEFLTLN